MNKTQQSRDRDEAALPIDKLEQFENEVYKNTVLAVESEIAEHDKLIKQYTKDLHEPHLHSPFDLKAKRKLRLKIKKSRKKLVMKLDLLRK